MADQASTPNGAFLQMEPNDKLLIPPVVSNYPQVSEQDMTEAEISRIVSQHQIKSLQEEINNQITLSYRTSRALDTSA